MKELTELLEKTASLLDARADEMDSATQAKVASDRQDLEFRLQPAFEQLKLSSEESEQILESADENIIGLIEKLAEERAMPAESGEPEYVPALQRRTEAPPREKTASARRKPTHRGRRRDSRELKRETLRREGRI